MTNRITEHFDDMDELLEAGAPDDFSGAVYLYLPTYLLADRILQHLGEIALVLASPDTQADIRPDLQRAQNALVAFDRRLHRGGERSLCFRVEHVRDAEE